MARPADPLQERIDRAGRAELAHQVDVADVDAELERCGRDQHLQLAALQALLRVEAQIAWRDCRGERRPTRYRGVPRGDAPRVRQAAACSRTPASCGAPGSAAPAGRRSVSTPRWTSPLPAARRAARLPGRDAAGGRCRRCGSARCRPHRCRARPPGVARLQRSVPAWPTGRCASGGDRRAHRDVRATVRDACRAWCRRPRGFHRRSRCAWWRASRGPRPSRAGCTGIPES